MAEPSLCYTVRMMRIVGCFLEHDGKFLILLRHAHKPDGGTWGLPAGKVEPDESDKHAMVRELREETGYHATEEELEHLGDFPFTSSRGEQYVFATFRVKLDDPHELVVEEAAHADHKWVTPEECYARTDLIDGAHELLRLVGYIS